MRIRKVTAHAFGPLVAETLELADGMTVVVGDNESAKSTWHAAIYAALCGRRRGRGRPREDEQHFIDLHRPWDRDNWLVSAEVVLNDGRRIEMRQDLAGMVDCHARDLDIGEDVSAQVMNDGAPDGARWLGLDRSSFLATACVEQAQLLRVLGEADGLQEHLQRAASAAGTDTTAAAALDLIDVFERERVGLDRANSTRPLRRALNAVRQAEDGLAGARQVHEEYLRLTEQADGLREAARRADAAVRVHEAAEAAHLAVQLAAQARRAALLDDSFAGTPPASAADDDALALQAAEALTAWRSRPDEPTASGPTARQIQQRIDALPAVPAGDLDVHDSVRNSLDRLNRAEIQVEQHEANRPADPHTTAAVAGASDEELLDLARTLQAPTPAADPALVAQEGAARQDLRILASRARAANLILTGAAMAAVAGIALLLTGASPAVGAGVLAVAVALAAFSLLRRRRGSLATAMRRHAEAWAQLTEAERQTADGVRRREDAVRRCGQIGIDADPQTLRSLVTERARAASHADDLRRWADRHNELQDDLASAAAGLSAALISRDHPAASTAPAELAAAVQSYRAECGRRAEQASRAGQRAVLEAQLEACQAAELRAGQDREVRAQAAHQVAEAGAACGLPAGEADDVVNRTGEMVERAQRAAGAAGHRAE
jgi:exonuclease SbcC